MAKKGTSSYDDALRILAENVKRLRLAVGLNQQEASRRAGVFHNYVGKLERGEAQNPGLRPLTKVADALGTNLAALFTPRKHVK